MGNVNNNKIKSYQLVFSKYSWWLGGGGVKPVGYYSDNNFGTTSIIGDYKGRNLDCVMLCEPISSYNEEKEGNKITCNHHFNLKSLTRNIDIFYCTGNFHRTRLYRCKYTSKISYLMLRLIMIYLCQVNRRE